MKILEAIKHRPLLWAALALILGLSLPYSQLFGIAAIGFLVYGLQNYRDRLIFVAIVGTSLFFAPSLILKSPTSVDGEAIVVSVPRVDRFGKSWCLAMTDSVTIKVALNSPSEVSLGDKVFLRGPIKEFEGASSEAWIRRGVVGQLTSKSGVELLSPGPSVFRAGLDWRESFRSFTARVLDPQTASLLDALCFNVDGALDPDLNDNLKRSGTIHIVSASGLHVVLFAFGLQWILAKVPIARPWQLALLVAILLIYAGAAGLRPPVIRAVLMASGQAWAYIFRREFDSLSALGGCAIFQCFLDPYSIFDPGFQLSYIIVAALSLFPYFRPDSSVVTWIYQEAKASWVATVSATPLLLFYFGMMSFTAVVSNLVMAPVIPLVIGTALSAWAIHGVMPEGAAALLGVSGMCSQWIVAVANAFGELPFAAVENVFLPSWAVVLLYLCLVVWWKFKPRPVRDPIHQT